MELHHLGFCVRDNLQESIEEWEYLGYEKMVEIGRHPTKNMDIVFMKNGGYRIEMMSPSDPTKDSPVAQPLKATKAQIMNYHCGYSTDDTAKSMRWLMGENYAIASNVTPGWLPCVQQFKLANMRNFDTGMGLFELLGTYSSEEFVE